jgi:hypothetical protein
VFRSVDAAGNEELGDLAAGCHSIASVPMEFIDRRELECLLHGLEALNS